MTIARILVAVTLGLLSPLVLQVRTPATAACSGSGSSSGGTVGGGVACQLPPSVDPGDPGGSGSGGGSTGASDGPVVGYNPLCEGGGGGTTEEARYGCGGTVECGNGGTMMGRTIYYPDGSTGTLPPICVEPGEEGEGGTAPVITPGMILAAFERMPLPDSELTLQPPGGETLVNFDTIFSTSNEPETTTITLLGQSLDLEAGATSYEWHHGDGSTQTTDWEGKPFEEGTPMSEFISYRYLDAFETVEPSVDTTWSARYRLNGGPWQPVAGTVTIEGDSASLRVVEGQPNLVG